jgi:hypothetical protein
MPSTPSTDEFTSASAMTIPTLFAGKIADASQLDALVAQTATGWQMVGVDASFEELSAVTLGAEPNRMIELVGRIAAGGEQLALAGASHRDSRAWDLSGPENVQSSVSVRALSEIAGYYSISAAHGLVNATARLYALEHRSRTAFASAGKGRGSNDGFPPFGGRPSYWLPFNQHSVDLVSSATTHHSTAAGLKAVMQELLDDPRWSALATRRNTDFHRWRPQSIEGGVAPTSPWVGLDEDTQLLAVFDGNIYAPESASALRDEAAGALEALTDAMSRWLSLYPDAKEQVLTFVLASRHGEDL